MKETQTRARFVECNVSHITDLEAAVEVMLNMVPLHRVGQPKDIGDAAVYLASDMSNYITGASLIVDGG